MAQQEVMYGQISQLMHPPEASKGGDFPAQSLQRPAPSMGFVPFHQQQVLHAPVEARQPQPSLSLSLEQPDTYRDVSAQQYMYPHEGQFRPAPTRPSFELQQPDAHPLTVRSDVVRPFDLEQAPFQHSEQPNHLTHEMTFTEPHLGRDNDDAAAPSDMLPASNTGAYADQVDDDRHLQIISVSELPSNDQSGQQQCYPPASAYHEDVIQDPELFMTTLENFHVALGTRLTIPTLGGSEMNLHAFYFQVTARGGLKQVIRAGLWKELSGVLDIPRHLRNVSFVLRKIYVSLLFHYEQVYYFREEGPLQLPPAPLPAASPVEQTCDDASPYEVPPEMKASLKKRKRKLDPMHVFGVDPAAAVDSTATGVINGKFEEGYFVTVVVGTEKLSGVIYHVSAGNKAQQYASVPSLIDSIGSEGNAPGMEIQLYGCKKRKEYVRKINPNAPKRTRTAYNIYFKEQRARLIELHPDAKGLGKKVIEMWNNLSEAEKAPYVARGSQERQKYLAEYEEQMRLKESQAMEGANEDDAEQIAGNQDEVAYDVSHDYHVSLDMDSDPHGGQPQVPEPDQDYDVYRVNGLNTHVSDSELTGGHLMPEQEYEAQENEDDYPQEQVSEEDEEEDEEGDDAELQEAYEDEEDEQVYPNSENIFEAQDGSEYQVSDKESDDPKDVYHVHADEVSAHESQGHSGSPTPKQQHYGQDHGYSYGHHQASQQQAEVPHGSMRVPHYEQVPYQMQDNGGQVLYPYMQQGGHLDSSAENPMSQQHYFTPNRYNFSQGRQGQGGEALGLPMRQEQGPFRRQEESSFVPPYQQSQAAMGPNLQPASKIPSELAYQDRYSYTVPMPYPQIYMHPPHAYHVRYPHPPYPVQMNDSVALQYGHTYAAQVHPPQPLVPEEGRPTSQVYQGQEGGHAFHSQDGSLTSTFKHNAHK